MSIQPALYIRDECYFLLALRERKPEEKRRAIMTFKYSNGFPYVLFHLELGLARRMFWNTLW